MKVTIIGTGYVGLVSGVCLSSKGHKVTCVDIKEDIVNNLNKGKIHIYEKGLQSLLTQSLNKKLFSATTNITQSLDNSDLVILAVGTPSNNGEIDLSQIKSASKEIGEYIKTSKKFISVVVKSTVVPPTTSTFIKNILETTSGKKLGEFGLGMNPEFLREGEAVEDFMYPDRIVIGYEDEITKNLLTELYSPWDCSKIYTNTRTAEMIKYVNNTMLASIISINNELANLSFKVGEIDYMDVIEGVIQDKRWTSIFKNTSITPQIKTYFTPGAGFGGSCFPKDVQAIRTQGNKLGLNMPITNAVLNLNSTQPDQVIEILGDITNKNILLLGLSFKPDTDDIRESSALKILPLLLDNGAYVTAHDPVAIPYAKKEISHDNLQYTHTWKEKVKNADIVVVGTNWEEYLDLKELVTSQIIFDSKRLFLVSDFSNVNYLTFGYSKKK